MLLNFFQGNTGGTGTRILVYFTGILMWTQRVFLFFWGGGGMTGRTFPPPCLTEWRSFFELSFSLAQVSKLSMTFKTDVVTRLNKRYKSYKGRLSTRAV